MNPLGHLMLLDLVVGIDIATESRDKVFVPELAGLGLQFLRGLAGLDHRRRTVPVSIYVPSWRGHRVAGDDRGIIAQGETDGICELDGAVRAGQSHWNFLGTIVVLDPGGL